MVGNENLRKDPGFPSHSGSGSLSENEISTLIVGAAIEVHRALGGPGLLESVYEEALAYELEAQGLNVNRQVVFQSSIKAINYHPICESTCWLTKKSSSNASLLKTTIPFSKLRF
jgi:hypothetical protein